MNILRRDGWRVSVVNDRVTDFAAGPPVLLRTDGGTAHPVDRVVLAVAHVAVIGSGLTAVDIAAGLAEQGHRGPITLLSRTGVLPFVQQRPLPLTPRHLTPAAATHLAASGPVTFDEVVALLRAELADSGEDFGDFAAELLATGTADPVSRLRRQLDAVDSPALGRRLLTMRSARSARFCGPRCATRTG